MEFQFLMKRHIILFSCLGLLFTSCEKEIEVDLPETEPRVVVEGYIETGAPPVILLTRTQGYFAPTSITSIASSFISEADVVINDGNTSFTLTKICSSALTPEQLELAASLTGFDVGLLASANICIWTSTELFGENGHTYQLNVQTDGKQLSSITTIPNPVQLDTLWFQLALQQPDDDSLGFIWTNLDDPDTLGNAYRWFTQRLNKDGDPSPRDRRFIPPLFGIFDDRYINGINDLPVNFYRGSEPYDSSDELSAEDGFFKRNDTVAFKFTSIGRTEYAFFNSYANNVVSDGDVFSTPANIRSNIEGGLGIWVGYGVFLDTLICVPQ